MLVVLWTLFHFKAKKVNNCPHDQSLWLVITLFGNQPILSFHSVLTFFESEKQLILLPLMFIVQCVSNWMFLMVWFCKQPYWWTGVRYLDWTIPVRRNCITQAFHSFCLSPWVTCSLSYFFSQSRVWWTTPNIQESMRALTWIFQVL